MAQQTDHSTEEQAPVFSAKQRKKELRSCLIGDLRLSDDGKLIPGGSRIFTPWGAGDGALSVSVFGIKRKTIRYSPSLKNNKQVMFQSAKAMKNIGRVIYMETAPDANVCYIRRPLIRATVLIFEEADDGSFTLTAFCGRSPLAFLAVKRSVGFFEEEMKGKIKRKDKEKA